VTPDTGPGIVLMEGGRNLLVHATSNGGREIIGSLNFDAYTGAFSTDKKELALGGKDGTLRIYSSPRGEKPEPHTTLKGHVGTIRAMAFSPDGKLLISGGQDKSIRIWDLAKKAEIARYVHSGAVTALVADAEGKHFFSGSADKSIAMWWMPNVARTTGTRPVGVSTKKD
jgi:WD40 repeat protein